MISILTAYKKGLFAAWREKKLLFWLYGFNLLFAFLMTVPLTGMLSEALDQTTAADKILQSFDFTIYTTIVDVFGKGIDFGKIITTIVVLYLIVNIFFAGGILKIFIEKKKFNLKDFLSGCVQYFNRFLKLFLISTLFVIISILIYLSISGLLSLITDNSPTEHLPAILFLLGLFFLGIMLAAVNMLFDYAKIMTIVNDYYGMFRTTQQAIVFVMMNLRKTFGLYFSYLLTAIILMLCYLLVENLISVTGWLTIGIFFLWTQLFMISRIWIRMSFFAGQYTFYRSSKTAMPGMTIEMLDMAVAAYEERLKNQKKNTDEPLTNS